MLSEGDVCGFVCTRHWSFLLLKGTRFLDKERFYRGVTQQS